ncbi:MAG TPA: hypothetical protein VIO94_07445, partial [Phenylobacterium sp.]
MTFLRYHLEVTQSSALSPAEKHTPEPEDEPAGRPKRRLVLIALGVVVAALALSFGGAFLVRRDLARDALVGWLDERGVHAEVEIEKVGLRGVTAKIRAGTPGDPEFAVEQAEVDYVLQGAWTGDPLGAEVRKVRLVRPVLRGSFKQGRLTFGPLDKIIEEFRRRPPRPDARKPLILIEDGLVGMDTDYGLARIRGDARIEDNRLISLEGRLAPASVKAGGVEMALRGGEISLRTHGDRVAFSLGGILGEAKGEAVSVRESFLRLTGEGPYPDFEKRRGDGALALNLTGSARELQGAGAKLSGSEFTARFNGRTTGWLDTLAIAGRGGLEMHADDAKAAGLSARQVQIDGEAATVAWSRSAPLSAQGRVSARAAE